MVKIWDSSTGYELLTLHADSGVWDVSFSPDGKSIAGSTMGKTIVLWESAAQSISDGKMIERIQQAKKNRALFEAVKKGDVEQVKWLITEGVDVDAKWRDVYSKNEDDPWPKDTERTA